MGEEYDFDAAAGTIKIEDIKTDDVNREILRKLKENDPNFDKVYVRNQEGHRFANEYCPEGARDLGWLGYYIGRNTTLKELFLHSDLFEGFSKNKIHQFCVGVSRNRSIQKIFFGWMDLSGGEIFHSLSPFFRNNHNLSKLVVEDCQFWSVCVRQIALVLRGCNKSLKSVKFTNNRMGDDVPLVDIIEALSAHPQLEKLELHGMNVGRTVCMTALANLLRHTTTNLQKLNLWENEIDDDGVDALVGAIITNSRLSVLDLSSNPNITSRGCQSLAALLELPNFNLEQLYLIANNIGDKGALIFANAMASNRKLMTLSLSNNGITAEGWSGFSKLLCDTSNINNTFLSNHTLSNLGMHNMEPYVASLLELNGICMNKRQVAIEKILMRHQHFDMQPFFEWDLKVLPFAIKWFERAK